MADSQRQPRTVKEGNLRISPFEERDSDEVRALFVAVNRLLAPPDLAQTFEDYIHLSLGEEINRIPDYYLERNGSFWVARIDSALVGMFGLEKSDDDAMELRRMYVDPARRRLGIAKQLLSFAEAHCRSIGVHDLELSTSQLQHEALALYRGAGYRLAREEIADTASTKTIGNGIRRFYFRKTLG